MDETKKWLISISYAIGGIAVVSIMIGSIVFSVNWLAAKHPEMLIYGFFGLMALCAISFAAFIIKEAIYG